MDDFLDIIHLPDFYLKRFGYWDLTPSSGKNLLSCAQSIELFPASEYEKLNMSVYISVFIPADVFCCDWFIWHIFCCF
jgi:hypothetical protein